MMLLMSRRKDVKRKLEEVNHLKKYGIAGGSCLSIFAAQQKETGSVDIKPRSKRFVRNASLCG